MSSRALTALAIAFALLGAVLLTWNHTGSEQAVSSPARPVPVAVPSVPAPTATTPRPAPTQEPTSAPAEPAPAPSPSMSIGSGEGDDIDVPLPATPPAAEDAPVMEAARRVVQAYARPTQGVTQQQWWARVEPLLSPQARSDYQYVQGAKVAFTKVIADPLLETPAEGEDSHLAATVLVPTDAGTYEVQLLTVDGTSWLASRIAGLEGTE